MVEEFERDFAAFCDDAALRRRRQRHRRAAVRPDRRRHRTGRHRRHGPEHVHRHDGSHLPGRRPARFRRHRRAHLQHGPAQARRVSGNASATSMPTTGELIDRKLGMPRDGDRSRPSLRPDGGHGPDPGTGRTLPPDRDRRCLPGARRGVFLAEATTAGRRPARWAAPRPSASIPARTWAPAAKPARSPPTMRSWRRRSACCATTARAAKYYHDIEGYNGRLDAIQAGILSVKLRHLPEWNARRREAAAGTGELFAEAGLGELAPFEPAWSKAGVSPVRGPRAGPRQASCGTWRRRASARQSTIPVPLHLQKAYESLGYRRRRLPGRRESGRGDRVAAHVPAVDGRAAGPSRNLSNGGSIRRSRRRPCVTQRQNGDCTQRQNGDCTQFPPLELGAVPFCRTDADAGPTRLRCIPRT